MRPCCPQLQPCFFWKTGVMFPKAGTEVPPCLSNQRRDRQEVRGLTMPEQPNFLHIRLASAELFSCRSGRKSQTPLMEPKSCTVLFWKHGSFLKTNLVSKIPGSIWIKSNWILNDFRALQGRGSCRDGALQTSLLSTIGKCRLLLGFVIYYSDMFEPLNLTSNFEGGQLWRSQGGEKGKE